MISEKSTVGEIAEAINKMDVSPYGHGYSNDEVELLLSIKAQFHSGLLEGIRKISEKLTQEAELANKAAQPVLNTISDFRYMADQGWYIGIKLFREMPLFDLIEIARSKDYFRTRAYIDSVFDHSVDGLFEGLKVVCSERSSIFDEIIKVYKLEFYHSAIALCYTQVDGLSQKFLSNSFFDGELELEDGDNKVYSLSLLKLNFGDNIIANNLKNQMKVRNEISKSYAKKRNVDDPTESNNRHLVLHGYSYGYGTRENAMKAILLLSYIGELIESKLKL